METKELERLIDDLNEVLELAGMKNIYVELKDHNQYSIYRDYAINFTVRIEHNKTNENKLNI